MENHYVDFSTSGQTVKMCKISVKSPYHEILRYFPIKHILKFDSAKLINFPTRVCDLDESIVGSDKKRHMLQP